ncbi:MAG: hypothetical protein JRI38_03655 [Deltaproteobacteria bacterium]|nr:hypothetical protein [Deltaproteobacteria bacterium]
MRNKTIITVILSLVLLAGFAQAETKSITKQKNIQLGLVEMPLNEYESLKAMVAGKYASREIATQLPEPMENLGTVMVSRAEASTIRAMVAGTYTPSSFLLVRQETPDIDIAGLTMPQSDYEAIKAMVRDFTPKCVPLLAQNCHDKVQ